MIKVLIVEDEVLVAEELALDLEENGFKVTAIAISSEECMDSISKNKPHVVLMDINIRGQKDGIETARIINKNNRIPIIYLTANTDTTTIQRAIETAPNAFISKPFNKKDVVIALELAFNSYNESLLKQKILLNDDNFFVKSGKYFTKINLSEVDYLEANGSYTEIYTPTKNYTLSTNLNHFQENLNQPIFVRIHRSFIVNIKKVEAFDNNTVVINGKTLPISKSYQKSVFSFFNKL